MVGCLGFALANQVAAVLALADGAALYALGFQANTALASALVSFRAAKTVPGARPGLAAIVAFAFVLTLPALGLLGLTWVLLPHWASGCRHTRDRVLELELPEFHRTDATAFDPERGHAPIEDELSPERPIEQRVRSVMALRRMDPQRAVPLLRIALGDASEDVRLLAYAILERREKQIRRRIGETLARLREDDQNESAEGQVDRAILLRSLASDHWELVYGGFSEGAGQVLNLEQAALWAEAALQIAFHGTTAILLARVRLKQGDAMAARQLIERAEQAGVATHVCAPLLAEAAFLLREFEVIPRLLAHVEDSPLVAPRLLPVARFWTLGGTR